MAASNTRQCFTECIGKSIKGVLFDALPVGRADLQSGNVTLVFDDGTGLTMGKGSAGDYPVWWLESIGEIARAISIERGNLENMQARLKDVISMAGL